MAGCHVADRRQKPSASPGRVPLSCAPTREHGLRSAPAARRLGGKISGNVGRVLSGERFRYRPHDSPWALARAIVVELLEDHSGIYSGESRDQARRAHARLAMAGRTIQCDERAMLRVAGLLSLTHL